MPEIELNCQNLPCPQPVLKCKDCIDTRSPAQMTVIVDNAAAKENVTRFLGTRGYAVTATETPQGAWKLQAVLESSVGAQSGCEQCEVLSSEELRALDEKTVVLITTEVLGSGDDILGTRLMKNFLATLPELGSTLWRVVLLNGGVKLASDGHEALPELQKLESAGVDILVCGTCLDFFGLLERKAAGQTTNMLDVVTSLQLATKVIRP